MTCAHGKTVGCACDYCGTAKLARRPALAISMPDGARVTQFSDGATLVEAGERGFTIEAGGDDDDVNERIASQVVTCDGCGDQVVAGGDRWTECACGTATRVLP